MRVRRWKWLAGVAAAAAVIVAAAIAASCLLLRDSSTPVDVDEVVDEFRDDGRSPASLDRLPEAGVYVYATEGAEEVDALAGTRHEYPAETAVTVSAGGCGVELHWGILEERFESWELCLDGEDLRQPGYVSFHRFFGQPDTKSFVCERLSMALPDGAGPGDSWTTDCAAGSLREVTTFEVEEVDDLDVAGVSVSTVRIRTRTEVSGSSTGSSEGEIWLVRDSGLPVRWTETTATTSLSAIGPVRYDESFVIELESIEPRR